MKFRNPRHNRRGGIDCEIEHPRFGWIPFTASPDDPEPHGRAIYEAILASGRPVADAPPEPAPPLPSAADEARARIRNGPPAGQMRSLEEVASRMADLEILLGISRGQ